MRVWGAIIILLVIIITGCNKSGSDKSGEDSDRLKKYADNRLRIEIKTQLANYPAEETKPLTSFKQLSEFYSKNNYNHYWIKNLKFTSLSDSLFSEICTVAKYGLESSDYKINDIKNLLSYFRKNAVDTSNLIQAAKLEIFLTDAFFILSTQLSEGTLNEKKLTPQWKGDRVKERLFEQMTSIKESTELSQILAASIPSNINFQRLLKSYNIYRYKIDSVIRNMELARYDTLKVEQYKSSRHFLISYLQLNENKEKETKEVSINYYKDINYLKEMHKYRLQQIVVNLERYKLKYKTNYPDTCIVVNIPSFDLRFFENNKELLYSKVIVGEPETPTPSLTSRVNHFYIYPTWSVPFSIASKEILPEVQKDSTYLADQNMDVLDKEGKLIDPSSIDWSILSAESLSYRFRQREGDHNSLGIIKFVFNNKYGVYLHDTNAKYLFAKDNRSLSHGCVRVEKAFDLAVHLTKYTESEAPENIEDYIEKRKKKYISLKKTVPVFIDYFTCVVNNTGEIQFCNDIYEVDKKMILALAKR